MDYKKNLTQQSYNNLRYILSQTYDEVTMLPINILRKSPDKF